LSLTVFFLACVGTGVFSAWGQEPYKTVYEEKTGLDQASIPLLIDLFNTPVPEIVLSDLRGRMEIRDSETGRLLISRSVTNEPISPPTAGDFLGEGRLHLVVGTRSGRVLFLDGGTLDLLGEKEIAPGAGIYVQPTTVRMTGEGAAPRDAVVLTDVNGVVRCCMLDANRAVQVLWEVSCQASQFPAAYGPVRDKDALDVVAAAGKSLVLINAVTGENSTTHVGKVLQAAPCLVDLDGDSLDEVVLANETHVNARKYNPSRGTFQPYWSDASQGLPITMPVRSADPVAVPRSGSPPLLIQAGGRNLTPVNPSSPRQPVWPVLRPMPNQVYSSLSVVVPASGPALVVFADENGNIWILNAANGISALDPAAGMEKAFTLGPSFVDTTLVAGVVGTEGEISLWAATNEEKSRLVRIDLRIPSARGEPNSVLWATRGGNLWHSGIPSTPEYRAWQEERVARLRASVDEHLQAYEQAVQDGETARAVEEAAWLHHYDPFSDEYRGFYRSSWIRKNLITLILGVVLVVLFVGYTSWKVTRMVTRRMSLRKAETATHAGRLDEARLHYEKVLRRYPKDPRVNTALASVYVAQGASGEETLSVYHCAHETLPGDSDLLTAYARALALVPETTDEALKVYEEALSTSPEPGLLEYAIGCCLKTRQDWNESAKHLRAALRSGFETEQTYSALCETYLAMDYRQAKAVPVFKQQFQSRQDDQHFLEAYLGACADAKLVDQDTENLCLRILDANPRHVGAYCQLAKIRLQKRNQKGAAEAIDRALLIEPDHPEALFLRAQINMIEGRADDQTVDNYVKALRHFPEDRDILRTLAAIFASNQRYDATAIDIYRRASRENPNDVTTLRALAASARVLQEPALAIDVIERLATLGQSTPELTLQLAQAYVQVECAEAKVERVLREALRQDPENKDFTRLLARSMLGQDKTDAEAMPVYERACRESPGDLDIGRQLVKTYNRNSRYSQALQLAQHFLKIAPGDDELQRLVALSSLYGNKIDEAIQEYKQILTRNPNDREAVVNLALAYAQKGKTDEVATRYYQHALEITPDNETLHLIVARVQATRGDFVRCVESYQKALKSKPHVEDKVLRHCEALLNEFPQALRVRWFFCEVLVAYNRLREALDQLGIIYESTPAQAKNVLVAIDKILNKDSRNVLGLLKRGEIQLDLGRPEEARASLERAFTLQPGSPEAQNGLIRCYESILAEQDDADIRFRLGKLHFLTHDYDKAIGCFQRTSQDYRWEAESAKMLGKCFVGKGMLDLALQEFKKLVVDDETKELLYDLAQRYESKRDLVGAKTVYRQLFAADINYKDVKQRFEMLSGSTSDPVAFEKTSIVQEMSEEAKRRYELLDELGRGAMGIVYRARDKELEEVVALKILPDNLSNNPEAVRRFKVEARNARRLAHPNIVRIHDIGEEMGRKYISMELVEGFDLKKRIRNKGKLPLRDALRYGLQVAEALAYAHRLGIVHRDIKPANIMITKRDEVKVTDFGIAKVVDATSDGTLVGAVIGTPLYMSPEQVQGVPVDNRADIYSYGVMLYEFIHGKPPFTEGDLAYQHMHVEPQPPAECPKEAWDVIQKCLAKRKEDRWESVDIVVDHLRAFMQTLA